MKPTRNSVLNLSVVFAAVAVMLAHALAQTNENGKILERKAYVFPEYEKVAEIKDVFTKEEYDAAITGSFETERVVYSSDKFKVAAYLYRPKTPRGRLPVVVFNRGGYIRGNIAPEIVPIFHRFAKQGFIVVAPLYRGSDGAEGKDEVGGDDLSDLMNVVPLIRSLDFADANNIFLYGESRGGTMVFQAIRDSFPANAAATYGSFSDFDGFVGSDIKRYIPLLKSIWPDYEARKAEIAQKRSAILWPDKMNVPLLLLHGGDDPVVDPVLTLRFAEKLQQLKKPYELLIYAGDNHTLMKNQLDRDARVAAWFKKYIKK